MAGQNSAHIKTQLEERLASLIQREHHVEAELCRPIGAGVEEAAIAIEGEEVLVQVEDSMIAEIDQIRLALERIKAGRYGECVVCGKRIPKARLQALPEASSCVGCA